MAVEEFVYDLRHVGSAPDKASDQGHDPIEAKGKNQPVPDRARRHMTGPPDGRCFDWVGDAHDAAFGKKAAYSGIETNDRLMFVTYHLLDGRRGQRDKATAENHLPSVLRWRCCLMEAESRP